MTTTTGAGKDHEVPEQTDPTQSRKARGGPTTEDGKRRSSMNALKHGLYAETMDAMDLLERSAGSSYEEALDRMRQHYGPKDGLEEELVRRIARCLWRLRLASMMEERILTRNPEMGRPGTSYEKIMKYERLVDIHLHRAIETLARKRDADNRNRSRNELYPRSP